MEPEPEEIEERFPDVDPVIPPAPRKTPRRGPPPRLVWAGLAALLALLALGVALFRNQVVQLWPKTAALYAAAGMSVNGVGLVIEQVRLTPAVQNGQAVLGISGRIRNERDHATPAAALQVTLVDSSGAPLARLVARPVDVVPALESRYFSVVVKNPPPGVASVALAFVSHVDGPGKAAAPPPAHGTAPDHAAAPAPAAGHDGTHAATPAPVAAPAGEPQPHAAAPAHD